MSPKTAALRSANRLQNAAEVILFLSIIGGVILAVVGFIPVCPPDNFDCSSYDEDFYNLPLFLGVAIAEVLFVWLLFAFASAFASQIRLRVAESPLIDREEANAASAKQVVPNRSDRKKISLLSEDQLTEWILAGEPSLSTWSTSDGFEEWLSKHSSQ